MHFIPGKNSIYFALFVFLICICSVQARELEVCPECVLHNPQKAVDSSLPGDTIVFSTGVHRVHGLLISHPLRITGKEGAVLDGGGQGHVLIIAAEGVQVDHLTIQNSGQSEIEEFAGIYATHGNCKIQSNHLLNNTYSIFLAKVKGCELENNIITGRPGDEIHSGNGIHIWNGDNIRLTGNLIEGHRDGFYFEFSTNMRILNNECRNNVRYGMHFMFSHENVFENNLFHHNETGVALMYSRHILVKNNEFRDSKGFAAYGLLLKDIVLSRFIGNSLSNNSVALFMDSSSRNEFEKNDIHHNGWAMRIFGNSDQNRFTDNQIRGNVFDISTNSRDNTNFFSRNYWSAYTGYDLNKDGTGDVPYFPVRVFGYWVAKYEILITLLHSPVVEFLEFAERAFPVITPTKLMDEQPLFRASDLSGSK